MPVQNRSLKFDKTFSQDLSAAALSYTTDYGRRAKVHDIEFIASVNITETITITIDSKNGATYDNVIRTINLVASKNTNYRPDGGLILHVGDELKIQCTNANATGTIRGYIRSSEITQ